MGNAMESCTAVERHPAPCSFIPLSPRLRAVRRDIHEVGPGCKSSCVVHRVEQRRGRRKLPRLGHGRVNEVRGQSRLVRHARVAASRGVGRWRGGLAYPQRQRPIFPGSPHSPRDADITEAEVGELRAVHFRA
jgi:hypothetical protein